MRIPQLARGALLCSLAACTWFAAPNQEQPGEEVAPEEKGPVCRPPSAKVVRGTIPWKEGQQTDAGYTVGTIAADNFEFIRVAFSKGDEKTTLEVAFNEEGAGDWSTERYRLMPAPGEEPSELLLTETMGTLKAVDQPDAPAFVFRREGVVDPYEGLPDCAPGQDPGAVPTPEKAVKVEEGQADAPAEAGEAPATEGEAPAKDDAAAPAKDEAEAASTEGAPAKSDG